MNFNQKHPT